MRSNAADTPAAAPGPPALALVREPEVERQPAQTPLRGAVRRANLAALVALQVLAVAAWCWWGLPHSLGGRASWVMVSGWSMQPRYHTGDLVLVDRQSSYHLGEVIAYRVPKGDVGAGSVVIHRIVGGNGRTGFVMQGDNRTEPDLWHPKEGDVIGAKTLHIPHAIVVVRFLRSPLLLGLLAGALVFARVLAMDARKTDANA